MLASPIEPIRYLPSPQARSATADKMTSNRGKGKVMGSSVGPRESPSQWAYLCLFKPIRYLNSSANKTPCKFLSWGPDLQIGGKGWN